LGNRLRDRASLVSSVRRQLPSNGELDRKELYAKARAGGIKGFTGSTPPAGRLRVAELETDTPRCSVDEPRRRVLLKLEMLGFQR